MNHLPRFPGISVADERCEDRIDDALSRVDPDYQRLVTAIEAAQQITLALKGDDMAKAVDDLLCDALSEAEAMKARAENNAIEEAGNGC